MQTIWNEVKSLFGISRERSRVSADEQIQPKGFPRLIVRDRDGNVVTDSCSGNLVVNQGRYCMVKFLTGAYSSAIQSIELGKGGVVGDPWTPVSPQPNDIALNTPLAPVVSKTIAGFEYGEGTYPTEVDFSVIFESFEVNDIVSEAVLKFADGKVYAKYTFPSVYLRNDKGYSLEIIWTIKFA